MSPEVKDIYLVIISNGKINKVFTTEPNERQDVWVYDGSRYYSYWDFSLTHFINHGIKVINIDRDFRLPEEFDCL